MAGDEEASRVQRSFSKSSSGPSLTPRASTSAGRARLREPPLVRQSLAGDEPPVIGKGLLQLPHDRSLDAEVEVPRRVRRAASTQCPARIFMPPRKPHPPRVGDEELAVRAQVQGHQARQPGRRVKEGMRHFLPPQLPQDRRPGIEDAGPVHNHSYGDAALHRLAQGAGEGQARLVPVEGAGSEGEGLAGLADGLASAGSAWSPSTNGSMRLPGRSGRPTTLPTTRASI